MTFSDDLTLENLVQELAQATVARGLRIATAESCTGGMLSAQCTAGAGSSDWFECGWVTYSNTAKTRDLNVDASLIRKYGAVSEPVAAAMASGALGRAEVDIAVSISGIAGPGGGSAAKPVGTVCFGLAYNETRRAETRVFEGDRDAVRRQATAHALQLLRSACTL